MLKLHKEIYFKDLTISYLKDIINDNKDTYKTQEEMIEKLLIEIKHKNEIISNIISHIKNMDN